MNKLVKTSVAAALALTASSALAISSGSIPPQTPTTQKAPTVTQSTTASQAVKVPTVTQPTTGIKSSIGTTQLQPNRISSGTINSPLKTETRTPPIAPSTINGSGSNTSLKTVK